MCSQSILGLDPGISRLENLPDRRALLRLGRALVDQYCSSFRTVPKRIVLDIDDTFDRVHGGQQLGLFNAYHDDYGFQPIVVFDGGCLSTSPAAPARSSMASPARSSRYRSSSPSWARRISPTPRRCGAPDQWQIDCIAEPTSKAASAAEATAAIEQHLAHVREISASFTPATSSAFASTANPLRGRAG